MQLLKIFLIPNVILCIFGAFSFIAFSFTPALSASASNESPKTIQGSVTENEMIDNLERVGIRCILHQGSAAAKAYLTVDSVRMGSSAFYKGVQVGDKIKGLATVNDLFTLQIERNGQPYQMQLRALTPSLASSTPLNGQAQKELPVPLVNVSQPKVPLLGVSQPKNPLVNVTQPKIPLIDVSPKDKEKKLMQYDIEMIIDITGSMLEKDGTGDLTKFEWCHEQVRDFARLMDEYKKTMNITTYNTGFNTEYHCNPTRVEEIYGSIRPDGNTCLVAPLIDRLEYCYHHQVPGRATILVVLTDGMPNVPKDPLVVNRAVVEFTKKLNNADSIIVTFLQIGDTFNGKSFCIDLDDNLVNEGARYDIIDTKTFDELKKEGLTSALIDVVTEKRSTGRTAVSKHLKMSTGDQSKVKDADAKLRDKMDERKALEKMLNFEKPLPPEAP